MYLYGIAFLAKKSKNTLLTIKMIGGIQRIPLMDGALPFMLRSKQHIML